MFEVTTRKNEKERRSLGASIVSIVIHAALLGIVFVLAAREVVEKPPEEVDITFFSQAPPPPPPPPPPAATKKTQKKKPKVEKKPDPVVPDELVQPEEIPEEIPEEEVEEVEEEVEGGEVGGQEGGEIGGKVGGQVGGKEGGKVGGDINSLGQGESQGLCTRMPQNLYPEQAKALGIEGNVQLRLLIDIDGRIVKRKDEACTGFAKAEGKERRIRWHPNLCIEAVSGPEALYYDTLVNWGTSKWKPWQSGNVNSRYYANMSVVYRLQ